MSALASTSCGHPVAPLTGTMLDYFTNWGRYTPRVYCMQGSDGGPDWPWIAATIVLCAGVVIGYLRILFFWRRCYLAEAPQDRNKKLMALAWIFLWCAVCGYLTSILMFFWPAYRLVALFLVVLNVWTWRFCLRLNDFGISFSAVRLRRELAEELQRRNSELERLVQERTAELYASREAEKAANASKSLFLANMSHEIRTPMTAILGYADILRTDSSHSMRAEATSAIIRNGDHLLAIINDILDLSKIEAGKLQTERIAVDPRRIADEVVRLLAVRAEAKCVRLRCVFAPDVPAEMQSDPVRLRQILLNLVGNAIKFTERGSVELCVSVAGVGDARQVVFEVRDTGIGIAEADLARLFQAFGQVDAGTTRRFGGTGLGLQISKRLTEMLGGEISVSSVPDEGSVFRVRFPLRAAPGAEHELGSAPRPPELTPELLGVDQRLRGMRILLAEDFIDGQRLISQILRQAGAEVTVVENGLEAVQALTPRHTLTDATTDDRRFDLVLMDIQMPLMGGDVATRELRARGCRLPIIALSAHALAEQHTAFIAAGCDDVQSKPILRERMIALAARWGRRGGECSSPAPALAAAR